MAIAPPIKRIAVSLPPPEDERFLAIQKHLLNTALRVAMEQRIKCALANRVSVFETEATVTPDPDRPHVVVIAAQVRGTPAIDSEVP